MNAEAVRDAAHGYLEQGFTPIPVGDRKRPLVRWSIYSFRLPTETELQAMLRQPGVGLGVVVGPTFDLAVVDVDNPNVYEMLRSTITSKVAGETPWYYTGRGCHLWFRFPEALGDRGTIISRDGVDLLLERHLVVCPPRGASPSFHGCCAGSVRESLRELPAKFIEWISQGSGLYRDGLSGRGLVQFFTREGRDPIPEGQRNNSLFRVACILLGAGEDLLSVCGRLARIACDVDGLPLEEAIGCVDSAHRIVSRGTGT